MRLKAAGVTFAIFAFALIAHSASAATAATVSAMSTPVAPPIAALHDAAAGLMRTAEQIIASIEAAIGGIVATLTNSAAPATRDYASFAAAVDASQAPPTVPTQLSSSTDPFGRAAQTATTTVVANAVARHEQPIVEAAPAGSDTVTDGELQGILTGMSDVLALIPSAVTSESASSSNVESQIAALQSAISSQGYDAAASPSLGGGAPNTIAAASAIDQLSGTSINDPTITGGSISGSSVNAGSLSVSGVTSLSGDLTVGGNFSAGSISFGAASSSGSITTNSTTTNLIATNATSTSLFSALGDFGTLIADTINASVANIVGFTATNATTTNLVATNATTTNFAALGTSYFAGNVGIGTTTPFTTFAVNGNAYFGGSLTAQSLLGSGNLVTVLGTGASTTRTLRDLESELNQRERFWRGRQRIDQRLCRYLRSHRHRQASSFSRRDLCLYRLIHGDQQRCCVRSRCRTRLQH